MKPCAASPSPYDRRDAAARLAADMSRWVADHRPFVTVAAQERVEHSRLNCVGFLTHVNEERVLTDRRRQCIRAAAVVALMVPSSSLIAASSQSLPAVQIELAQADTGKPSGGAAKGDRGSVAPGKAAAPAVRAPAAGSPGGEPRTTTRQRTGGDVPTVKGAVERRTFRDRQVDKPATPPRIVETPRTRPNGQRVRVDNDRDRDRNRRRGTRFYWGPGAEFFFFDGFYHGDCAWLRRKARDTGSRYWQQRYRQCRDW